MSIKLIVSVDAEENWEGPGSKAAPCVSNIYELPRLQADCFDKFNIRPIYLITFPVATDNRCIEVLSTFHKHGKCEIGAHLHNWNTPPFTEKDVFDKTYQFRLPYALEKQKIRDLSAIIENNFGRWPVIFRAGRWGADGETIKILSELKYKVDLSVHPLSDYTKMGGVDFFNAPLRPYFPSFENILIPDEINKNILEIPVTVNFSRPNFKKSRELFQVFHKKLFSRLHLIGILYRMNILRKIVLSPENSNFNEMKQLVDTSLACGHEIIHLTFHSSMVSAGFSPYSRNEDEKNFRIRNLMGILDYLVNRKAAKAVLAQEVYDEWLHK